MNKSGLEWKVGLFVAIGLALLGGLLLEFSKGRTFLRKTYSIRLHARDVGGLKVRANVLMSGVQVGTVSDIRLAPDGKSVSIHLKIFGDYIIHKDVRFVILTSGFLGDNYVGIIPTENKAEIFANEDVAEAESPLDFQEIARSATGFISHIDETAKSLTEAIADVRRTVLNDRTLNNLSVAIDNLRGFTADARETVGDLRAILATNGPVIPVIGSNLVFFSQQLNQFADALNNLVATNREVINSAAKNVESTTEVLNNLVADVQAGKGLAGTVLKNEDLATHVSLIASNLSVTSSNLNRLGLWGILWQHKPPKQKSSEPPPPVKAPKESSSP